MLLYAVGVLVMFVGIALSIALHEIDQGKLHTSSPES